MLDGKTEVEIECAFPNGTDGWATLILHVIGISDHNKLTWRWALSSNMFSS